MERTMSVEEKIKRAEEIYARRKEGNTARVGIYNDNKKKDIKLLKKMIIQIIFYYIYCSKWKLYFFRGLFK